MITVRPSQERGHAKYPWLDTYHTFSFDSYHDPKNMNFRTLRVINEDRVAAGQGFPTHPHRDMEIITYVLEGALAHKDSMGTGAQVRPGELQHMTAGSGITHSEFNPSKTDAVHLLQIWIMPKARGLTPSYDQKAFDLAVNGSLKLLASPDGRDGSLTIQQDVAIFGGKLSAGKSVTQKLASGRYAWVQVARGVVSVNGTELKAGDGAAVSDETSLAITSKDASELLLFDLA